MTYLIIFVVLAFVLAPVFWIMPSPGQKRQIQLRERAMALGLQIKICDLPQTRRAQVRKEPAQQGVVYRLHWRHPLSGPALFHLLCQRGATEPLDTVAGGILQRALDNLPETVVAIEYTNSGVAVYWREGGGVERVEQLYNALQGLQGELSDLNKVELESLYH